MGYALLTAAATAWAIERYRPGGFRWARALVTSGLVLTGGFVLALVAAVAP